MNYPSWLQGAGGGNKGELFNGYRVSVTDGEEVLEMDGGDSCTTM